MQTLLSAIEEVVYICIFLIQNLICNTDEYLLLNYCVKLSRKDFINPKYPLFCKFVYDMYPKNEILAFLLVTCFLHLCSLNI